MNPTTLRRRFLLRLANDGIHMKRIIYIVLLLLGMTSLGAASEVAVVSLKGKKNKEISKQMRKVIQKHRLQVKLIQSSSKAGNAKVIVQSTMKKKKRKWRLSVQVLDREQNKLDQAVFVGRNPKALATQVRKLFWKKLGKSIRHGVRRAESEQEVESEEISEEVEEPTSKEEEEADDADDSVSSSELSDEEEGEEKELVRVRGMERMEVAAFARVFTRSLSYSGDTKPLAKYKAPGVFAMEIGAAYYPIPSIGVRGHFSFSPGFDSKTDVGNQSFTTKTQGFLLDLHYRKALGSLIVQGELGYGGRNYDFTSTTGQSPIPDVRYRYVRGGAAVLYNATSHWRIGGGLGYRHLLRSGEISQKGFFPRMKGSALDGQVWAEKQVASSIQVRAGVDIARYSHSLGSKQGDTPFATSAVDQMIGAWLGAVYLL